MIEIYLPYLTIKIHGTKILKKIQMVQKAPPPPPNYLLNQVHEIFSKKLKLNCTQ